MLGPRFAAVLERARDGDELAWIAIHDDLSGPLLGHLRGRGAPEPEDQVGETFLQVARDLASFQGDEFGFRSWVFTIAHRRMLDASRSRRRRPVTHLPSERLSAAADVLQAGAVDTSEEAIARLVDGELLMGLLARLSDEQREVLLLRYVSDLDTATVGSVRAVAVAVAPDAACPREVVVAAGSRPGQSLGPPVTTWSSSVRAAEGVRTSR